MIRLLGIVLTVVFLVVGDLVTVGDGGTTLTHQNSGTARPMSLHGLANHDNGPTRATRPIVS